MRKAAVPQGTAAFFISEVQASLLSGTKARQTQTFHTFNSLRLFAIRCARTHQT
jgi:hypothetical protein